MRYTPGPLTTIILFPPIARRLLLYLTAKRIRLHPYVEFFLAILVSLWVPFGVTFGTGIATISLLAGRDRADLLFGFLMAFVGWGFGFLMAIVPALFVALLCSLILAVVDLVWLLGRRVFGPPVSRDWLAERVAERYLNLLEAAGLQRFDILEDSPREIVLYCAIAFPIVLVVFLVGFRWSLQESAQWAAVAFGLSSFYLLVLHWFLCRLLKLPGESRG
jgi:hypothetical protein